MLTAKPEVKDETASKETKIDDAKITALEESLRQTREQLTAIQGELGKSGERMVVETRDTLARRYPNADVDAVNDSLRVFFQNNQRHPSAPEIEAIVKRSHDFVSTKIEAVKSADAAASAVNLPPVVGGSPPPSLSKSKTPRLDDIDAWKEVARADNVVPG